MNIAKSAERLRKRLEFLEHIKKEGDKYVLYSKDGSKKLGTYPSMKAAKKREAQVEYFKHAEEETDADKERSRIIKKEMKKGHPQKQAIAISYSETGEKKK